MQRLFILITVCILTFLRLTSIQAETGDPSDLFLNAYLSVQQAEKLDHTGNFKSALSKYRYAASLLEQIQKNSPDWQPLIVDYRKKKTSESIAKLEEKISVQVTEPKPSDPGPLPQKDDSAASQTNAPTVLIPSATEQIEQGTREIRNQILDLQNQLKNSKEQLHTVQEQKDNLAKQLSETSKQFDKTKVSEAEIKAQLQAALELAKNSTESADPQALKSLQSEVVHLQNALKEAQADKDAADEQNAEFARKTAKARAMVESAKKERDQATQKSSEVETKYKAAQTQLESITKEHDATSKNLTDLESKYSAAEKNIKDLETAKAELAAAAKNQEEAFKLFKSQSATQIASLTKEQTERLKALIKEQDSERDTEQEKRDELSRKLAGAKKQVVSLSEERDEAGQKLKELTTKSADTVKLLKELESAQVQIATLTKDRDVGQQARVELSKRVTEAEKQVMESKEVILSISKERDDATKKTVDLGTKLTEVQIKAAESERQQVELAKQSADEQALVAALTKERNGLSTERNHLLTEVSKIKTDNLSAEEKKKQEEENGLLRGIVMRQLKEQARRDQARKTVLDELSKLQVKSDVLVEQVQYLGQPITKLDDKEKALFKQPQMQIADNHTGATFSMAAEKTSTPEEAKMPVQNVKTATAADDLPSKTKTEAPKQDQAPVVETSINPGVPDEFLAQARKAKEQFELGKYSEAEKIYESILAKVPNNIYALSNLGAVRFREGKLKEAEETFKKAIAIAPEDSFSYCTLGIVYYRENNLDDAITSLTKALAINPKYAMAHNYLGITASEKGWQKAALKEFQTALALGPNYGDANFNLAVNYAT